MGNPCWSRYLPGTVDFWRDENVPLEGHVTLQRIHSGVDKERCHPLGEEGLAQTTCDELIAGEEAETVGSKVKHVKKSRIGKGVFKFFFLSLIILLYPILLTIN